MFSSNNSYGAVDNTTQYDSQNNIILQNQVVMPQPTGLPWNIQEMSWGTRSPPTLVEFTGQQQDLQNRMKFGFVFKRKSSVEADIPNKQLKTDEVMAAHLNCLHISSNFTEHNKPDNSQMNLDYDFSIPGTSNNELMERLKSGKQLASIDGRLKNVERIVLCEEMRRLNSEPILPQSLMNKLEKPCMSLVLWKPPNKILFDEKDQINRNSNHRKPSTSKQSVLVSDANAMDVEL